VLKCLLDNTTYNEAVARPRPRT